MFTMIAVSFTLKGQSFEQIKKTLELLKAFCAGEPVVEGEEQILINGFMPKHVIMEKGFSPDVVNTLAELWPTQINCYTDKPERKKMADLLVEFGGEAYVIGEIVQGVREEIELYTKAGIRVTHVPVDWDGDKEKIYPLEW